MDLKHWPVRFLLVEHYVPPRAGLPSITSPPAAISVPSSTRQSALSSVQTMWCVVTQLPLWVKGRGGGIGGETVGEGSWGEGVLVRGRGERGVGGGHGVWGRGNGEGCGVGMWGRCM